MRELRNVVLFVGVVAAVVALVQVTGLADAGSVTGLSAISSALADSETEIRSSVFPAVVGILTAVLLISVAAGVVHIISRNR